MVTLIDIRHGRQNTFQKCATKTTAFRLWFWLSACEYASEKACEKACELRLFKRCKSFEITITIGDVCLCVVFSPTPNLPPAYAMKNVATLLASYISEPASMSPHRVLLLDRYSVELFWCYCYFFWLFAWTTPHVRRVCILSGQRIR